MDRKGKIIEKEIFHFVCKIHFWQAQEDDFPFPPPYFEKKKKQTNLKSCIKTNPFLLSITKLFPTSFSI